MSGRPTSLAASLPGLRRVFSRLWPYMRQHRAVMGGSLAALLVGTVFRLLEPWPLKYVFDQLIRVPEQAHHHHGKFKFLRGLDSLSPSTLLLVAVSAVVIFTSLRALLEYVTSVSFAKIGNRVLMAVRSDLYKHLQGLDLAFHSSARGGDLVVRLVNDVNMLRDAAISAIMPLLASVLVLAGMWGLMFWLNWKLTLLALVTVPLVGLRTIRLTGRIREAARKQRKRQGEMAATAAEALSSIPTVQALSLEPMFESSFKVRNQQAQKQDVQSARLSAKLERSVDVLLAIATGLVLWYGAKLVMRGSMSPGELIVFLTYLRRAFNPFQDFAKYTSRIAKATASGERVLDLLDRAPRIVNRPDAVVASHLRAELRFEDVTFAYEPGQPVLEGISFECAKGQSVAIVGPSGIGKSTLLALLLRLYDADSGRILIDGQDIRGFTLASLRAQVSTVPQDSVLFAASIRDNIAYGRPGCTNEEIESASLLANAHEFIAQLPRGYDTLVGERGVTLSGGQRQRLAVARAAVRNAPILILDEPTAGLDKDNARLVSDSLRRLGADRATLLVTHDLASASRADLILYFEHHKVAERGTHEMLMRQGGRYATLYRLQQAEAEYASLAEEGGADDVGAGATEVRHVGAG